MCVVKCGGQHWMNNIVLLCCWYISQCHDHVGLHTVVTTVVITLTRCKWSVLVCITTSMLINSLENSLKIFPLHVGNYVSPRLSSTNLNRENTLWDYRFIIIVLTCIFSRFMSIINQIIGPYKVNIQNQHQLSILLTSHCDNTVLCNCWTNVFY